MIADLKILRCAAPINIAVRCIYKYYGALHLQILRCAAPTNITVRCTYKYCGALHLQILRCAAPTLGKFLVINSTNITVSQNIYEITLSLKDHRCGAPKYL